MAAPARGSRPSARDAEDAVPGQLERRRDRGATARLEAIIRAQPPGGLAWEYTPRPDLTHATIFRGVEAAALAAALR